MDKTWVIQDKSTTVGVFVSKNIKRSRQGFLSEKLSEGYLKDKTRLIQDESTKVGVFYSKNIQRFCQGFLSEKLRNSQNKVIGREAQVRRSI
ncbi:hypothetical protein M0802_016477 [Mischocyttarus mexicanus]|nr:hypothetical protein M0802_016477 [Mischocyttarus mexicanus]